MSHAASVILTYHSQNIAGQSPAHNDHAALAEDLAALHRAGATIVPLGQALEVLDGTVDASGTRPLVALTFDDGCDFDVRDLPWPGVGTQRSLLGIMGDFIDTHGADAQPGLHATSFVIACPEARRLIDRGSLFGEGWMSEDWWADAAASGLLAIGNHGWDHAHPDLAAEGGGGGFETVNDEAQCERQVIDSARYIARRTGTWPEFFAYPFGESSAYLRQTFMPGFVERHRCRAALGTEPGTVTAASDRWDLPRMVCGRDWRSSEELLALIEPA